MIDSDPASSSLPNPPEADVTAPNRAGGSGVSTIPKARTLVATAFVAGLAAGFLSWAIGEAVVLTFLPPYHIQQMMGQSIKRANLEDQLAADKKNATLAFAVLGGVLAAGLGMAGGVARRSPRAMAMASLFGLVLGGLLGAGASMALLPVYFGAFVRAHEDLSRDLVLPLLVHGGIWAACGLAGGLAFGVGLGAGRTRTINAAIGGLIGAVMGAVLYEIIGAIALSGEKATEPLATAWTARLLARLLVATLSGTLAAVVIDMGKRQPNTAKGTP